MVRALERFQLSAPHMTITKPSDHPPVRAPKVGVLLLNLGTPDGTDYWSMRRYLSEFLSDRRVIESPGPLMWQLILQGPILATRPQKSGANYDRIWDREAGDSPLRVIARRQAEKLQTRLGDGVVVDFAMRYGNPSTASRIEALQQMRWQPAVRTLPPYYAEPAYVEALAQSIADGVAALDFEPDLVVTSYHGMPKEYLLKGDPYHCQCLVTTRLVRERLGWPEDRLMVTFQSRFGGGEWLQPYTDATLEKLGAAKKKIAVCAPAFSVDCIETLEEIAITGREQFEHAGGEGKHYAYIPCLNDTDGGMAMLEAVVRTELAGWI